MFSCQQETNTSPINLIKRGDIWLVDLPENEGNIQRGRRPCLVWSSDKNNYHSNIINVIPLSSRLNKVYPMHVLIGIENGLERASYALPEQYMPVMKSRFIHKIGECNQETMVRVMKGINIQCGMNEDYIQQIESIQNDKTYKTIDLNFIIEKLTMITDANDKIKRGFDVRWNQRIKESFERDLEEYCENNNLNFKQLINYARFNYVITESNINDLIKKRSVI